MARLTEKNSIIVRMNKERYSRTRLRGIDHTELEKELLKHKVPIDPEQTMIETKWYNAGANKHESSTYRAGTPIPEYQTVIAYNLYPCNNQYGTFGLRFTENEDMLQADIDLKSGLENVCNTAKRVIAAMESVKDMINAEYEEQRRQERIRESEQEYAHPDSFGGSDY